MLQGSPSMCPIDFIVLIRQRSQKSNATTEERWNAASRTFEQFFSSLPFLPMYTKRNNCKYNLIAINSKNTMNKEENLCLVWDMDLSFLL